MLSGPGRCALPLDLKCLNDLGFRPHTWGTASTSFLCKLWSRRNVNSSTGAMHPIPPSNVPNTRAKRFSFQIPILVWATSVFSTILTHVLQHETLLWKGAFDPSSSPPFWEHSRKSAWCYLLLHWNVISESNLIQMEKDSDKFEGNLDSKGTTPETLLQKI